VPGVIEKVCGEGLASDGENIGGREAEYTVEFSSVDVWGTTDEPPFRVFVDLYEHYLEAA
jgi:hypothetical protein